MCVLPGVGEAILELENPDDIVSTLLLRWSRVSEIKRFVRKQFQSSALIADDARNA